MSSLALMRFLESAPSRYDWGMRLITLDGITRVHETIAEHIPEGRALEIGCGTGAVTERLARKGVHVVAVDQNPDMMDIAKARIPETNKSLVEWRNMTASEIDTFSDGAFDAVLASFSLSEMAGHERAFVLRHAFRVLRAGGTIVVGDEVAPVAVWKRGIAAITRLPQLMLAWVLTGTWSRPIPRLADELTAADFAVELKRRWRLESLAVIVARKHS